MPVPYRLAGRRAPVSWSRCPCRSRGDLGLARTAARPLARDNAAGDEQLSAPDAPGLAPRPWAPARHCGRTGHSWQSDLASSTSAGRLGEPQLGVCPAGHGRVGATARSRTLASITVVTSLRVSVRWNLDGPVAKKKAADPGCRVRGLEAPVYEPAGGLQVRTRVRTLVVGRRDQRPRHRIGGRRGDGACQRTHSTRRRDIGGRETTLPDAPGAEGAHAGGHARASWAMPSNGSRSS